MSVLIIIIMGSSSSATTSLAQRRGSCRSQLWCGGIIIIIILFLQPGHFDDQGPSVPAPSHDNGACEASAILLPKAIRLVPTGATLLPLQPEPAVVCLADDGSNKNNNTNVDYSKMTATTTTAIAITTIV